MEILHFWSPEECKVLLHLSWLPDPLRPGVVVNVSVQTKGQIDPFDNSNGLTVIRYASSNISDPGFLGGHQLSAVLEAEHII